MSSSLLQRIAGLPQVVQDVIGEYNVTHRVSMNLVFHELCSWYHKRMHRLSAEYVFQELQETVEPYGMIKCDNCADYVSESTEYELDCYDYHYKYCSYFCMEEGHYAMRKYARSHA